MWLHLGPRPFVCHLASLWTLIISSAALLLLLRRSSHRLHPASSVCLSLFSGDAFPAAAVVYILRASVSSMQPSSHSLPPTCVWTSCLFVFFQANTPLTMCRHHATWIQSEKTKRMSPGGMTHYSLTVYLVHGHQLCQCPFKSMRCNFFNIPLVCRNL